MEAIIFIVGTNLLYQLNDGVAGSVERQLNVWAQEHLGHFTLLSAIPLSIGSDPVRPFVSSFPTVPLSG